MTTTTSATSEHSEATEGAKGGGDALGGAEGGGRFPKMPPPEGFSRAEGPSGVDQTSLAGDASPPTSGNSDAVEGDPRHKGLKPFQKGVSGNPGGRPRGARNIKMVPIPIKLKPGESLEELVKYNEHELAVWGLRYCLSGEDPKATRELSLLMVGRAFGKGPTGVDDLMSQLKGMSIEKLRERKKALEKVQTAQVVPVDEDIEDRRDRG